MTNHNKNIFNYLKEKGFFKKYDTYEQWKNKDKVEEPDFDLKGEMEMEAEKDEHDPEFLKWKSGLNKKDRDLFKKAFE